MLRFPLLRALGLARKYWLAIATSMVCLLAVTAANLSMPSVIRFIIDRGLGQRDQQFLISASLGLVGLAAVRGIFSFAQGYLAEYASQGIAYDLRNQLYAKIHSLSFSYHDRAQTGHLMTRATNDVDTVRLFAGFGLIQLLNGAVLLLGSGAILLSIHLQLALISMATMPLLVLATLWFARVIRPMYARVQDELDRLNTLLQESLAGVRVVKAFAREGHEVQRFRSQNEQLLQQNLRLTGISARHMPLFSWWAGLGSVVILLYGGSQVMAGRLTLGQLVAFNTYLMMLLAPVRMVGILAFMGAQGTTSSGRIFDILDMPTDIKDKPGAQPLPRIAGEVRFEHVTFRYIGGEDVLHDVDFQVRAGESVALLGATGSGKSTIINLIPRFYDVSAGRVLVDGHDVRDVTLESLRRQIGIVLQETILFSGTVRDNIAYGSPGATMEQIVEASKAAQAHDFVAALPQGYDTPVGERGMTLSGGQRQRIAIARAVLLDPRILILDDFTSSVDFETEYLIQQALAKLMQGRTSFIIAQRVGTVQRADLILVLDRGRLVAQGRHEELLRDSGIYAEIYGLQLGGQKELWPGEVESRSSVLQGQ